MLLVALFVLLSAGTTALVLSPAVAGTTSMWLLLGAVHAGIAGYAIWRMRKNETLADRLTPRGGDFTVGVMAAAGLLVGSWMVRAQLVPTGSTSAAWMAHVYLAVGDPNLIQRSALLTIVLLVVAGLEEITWRGLVQELLEERVGARFGWLVTAALFTASSLPTLWLLRDPEAGVNPLLVLAAAACGLVWGFLTLSTRRLWPAMFSHMVFLYFTAVQFRMPGITPDGL